LKTNYTRRDEKEVDLTTTRLSVPEEIAEAINTQISRPSQTPPLRRPIPFIVPPPSPELSPSSSWNLVDASSSPETADHRKRALASATKDNDNQMRESGRGRGVQNGASYRSVIGKVGKGGPLSRGIKGRPTGRLEDYGDEDDTDNDDLRLE
jgi:hypothetical protein